MASPPECPDIVLSLRDGTMLATTAAAIGSLHADCQLLSQTYNLPVYSITENPGAIQLFVSITADLVNAEHGDIPPLTLITALSLLCVKADRLDLCESHVTPWVRRWIQVSWHKLRAQVLGIALICNNKKLIMECYRALVLGNLSRSEIEQVDDLMDDIPDPLRITSMRSRLRQDLRTLVVLPISDHPSIARSSKDVHECTSQALDLTGYIRALYRTSIFPFPQDENEQCLIEVWHKLRSIREFMPVPKRCVECGFEDDHWPEKLNAIQRTLETSLGGMMRDFERYIFDGSKECAVAVSEQLV